MFYVNVYSSIHWPGTGIQVVIDHHAGSDGDGGLPATDHYLVNNDEDIISSNLTRVSKPETTGITDSLIISDNII